MYPFVLNIAIHDPGAMTNSLIASKREPSGWLAKHIEVEFIGESSVMVIRLRGTEDRAELVKQLVDAVCSAYQNEVVFANDQERLVVRDALAATVGHLKETLESEMTEQKARREIGERRTCGENLAASDRGKLRAVAQAFPAARRN
jgi:hypothetical protein